jgi:two-component system cell cycle sensor histidine kinase/response regulator CckA
MWSNLAGNEMKAEDKAKERLMIDELLELRQRIAELETSEEDRKRAEEALRKSEERYRRITAAVTDYIFTVYTENGHPVETVHGPACIAVTGYTPEEYASDPYLWFCMVHEEDRSAVQGQATQVLLGQDTQPIEHRIWRKDGVLRWVRSTLVPHYDIQGKLISYDGLISDITERRQAEEEKEKLEAQLQQAQKMEAVGTLAGGIAHDFNNLLMSIQGNISLMLLAMDPTHPHYERLKRTEEQVQTGARLAKQLLGYARKGGYEVKPTSLNQLVEETAETFGVTRKGITIQKEFAEGLFDIEVDRGQMEQVLLNLFINAADAMPKGGNLILKTRDTTHEGIKDIVYDAKPGNYVLLTVTDTGIGMDNETQARIFDPFFTTKERGRGTGLGLASVYGIIKAHGGYINVESGKEHGTTFSIYLPASEKKAQRTVKTVERCIKGTATVLMVDDEDALREVGQELLTVMGYRVLVARDGKEAIEVYRKNWHTIDLVLLDMIMPNMGGGEAYDCMREINPDIKVLLSSGYSVDGEADEILKRGCRGFIQKPFKVSELSRKIEEILQM